VADHPLGASGAYVQTMKTGEWSEVGGALFGSGWALAGTCPAQVLAMLSSSAIFGAIAIVGLFVGHYLRDLQVAATTAPICDGEHRDLVSTDRPAGYRG